MRREHKSSSLHFQQQQTAVWECLRVHGIIQDKLFSANDVARKQLAPILKSSSKGTLETSITV